MDFIYRINATVIGSKEAKEGEGGEVSKEGAGEGEGAHEETDEHGEAKPAAEGGETEPGGAEAPGEPLSVAQVAEAATATA